MTQSYFTRHSIFMMTGVVLVSVFIGHQAKPTYRYLKYHYFSAPNIGRELPWYNARTEHYSLSKITQADIVMVGDSNTANGLWSEWTGCESLVNRGIGGDTTEGMLRRIDDVLALKPKAVFFMGGVNDVVKKIPIELTIANLNLIMSRLSLSGAKAYMNFVFNVTDKYQGDGWPNQFIDNLNARIKKLSKKYPKITMIDLGPSLTNSGTLDLALTYDGLHLTALGYERWLTRINGLIEEDCK